MFEDTHALIERCIKREESAWSEFINRFSGLLYYSVRERLNRNGFGFKDQDVEDIVQNVFLEIWEKSKLEDLRDAQKIKAWLSIMGQTRALNFIRKKKELLLREDELFKIDNISSDSSGNDRKELIEELEKAVETLPAREKIILKLNVLYGKTHREIADFMHIPINTVSTIISRKKELLKKMLGGGYGMLR